MADDDDDKGRKNAKQKDKRRSLSFWRDKLRESSSALRRSCSLQHVHRRLANLGSACLGHALFAPKCQPGQR